MKVVVVLVVLVLLVAAAAYAVRAAQLRRRRTEALKGTFGAEYDRTLEGAAGRREAERQLRERKARHAELQLRPLPQEARERYRAQWTSVQAHFVDAPGDALGEADALLTTVMAERGYPTGDVAAEEELLSVQHAKVLDGFRAGHAVQQESAQGRAGTEQIRQAMLDFRSVFEELLDDEGGSRRVAG